MRIKLRSVPLPPLLGRLNKGTKVGDRMMELPHWTFTAHPHYPQAAEIFTEVYGKEPTQLVVRPISDDMDTFFSSSFQLWQQGNGPSICLRICDSHTISQVYDPLKKNFKKVEQPCICAAKPVAECKVNTTMKFSLFPGLPGYVEFIDHSIEDAVKMTSYIEWLDGEMQKGDALPLTALAFHLDRMPLKKTLKGAKTYPVSLRLKLAETTRQLTDSEG